jgi:hypothetical protein
LHLLHFLSGLALTPRISHNQQRLPQKNLRAAKCNSPQQKIKTVAHQIDIASYFNRLEQVNFPSIR